MGTTADYGERTGGLGDDAVRPKWVSLMCDAQFDIGRGRVRCGYSTADFMVTVHGDAVLLVPAAFRLASQMVAHAVLPDRGDGHVEIALRRPSIRCALPYRFAYVDGRLFDVMGVSDAFTFVHRDGTCDCGDGTGADSTTGPPTTTISTHHRTDTASVNMSLFVSFLMNTRSSAPQCSACGSPSNYRQVLEYLTENINYLSDVDSNIERERIRYIECLNNCNLILDYLKMKTKLMNREMENGRLFVEGLISSLLKNRTAIFQTGDKTILVKMDEIRESEYSPTQSFMVSIINSQKQKIENLIKKYNEILVMMNMIQLFTKVPIQ